MPPPPFWQRWFTRRPPSATAAPATRQPDPPAHPPHAEHKRLRAARREQLYALVREVLADAQALAGTDKFKAVTLDREAEHFLLLIDLQDPDWARSPHRLAELERALQSQAEQRLGMVVQQVYWRPTAQAAHPPPPPEAAHTASLLSDVADNAAWRGHEFAPTRPMRREDWEVPAPTERG